jgi:hypothetical protein
MSFQLWGYYIKLPTKTKKEKSRLGLALCLNKLARRIFCEGGSAGRKNKVLTN